MPERQVEVPKDVNLSGCFPLDKLGPVMFSILEQKGNSNVWFSIIFQ